MALKDRLLQEGLKLSQNAAVQKLLADERFMKLVVLTMSMPGRVSTFTNEQKERFAREMALATSDEVKDLKRQVASLEDSLRRLERKVSSSKLNDS